MLNEMPCSSHGQTTGKGDVLHSCGTGDLNVEIVPELWNAVFPAGQGHVEHVVT
jgi:hypothetical protein